MTIGASYNKEVDQQTYLVFRPGKVHIFKVTFWKSPDYHSFTNTMRKMKNSHRGESTELSPFNVTRQAVVTTLLDDLSNQVKTKTIFVVHEHFIGHLFVDMKIFSLEIIRIIYKFRLVINKFIKLQLICKKRRQDARQHILILFIWLQMKQLRKQCLQQMMFFDLP